MKRLLCLFLSFFVLPAFAVTSESYVDNAMANLQDEIPAIDSNTVLINTGTAGEVGTKQIYDANADYASQQNALITAETFNAAVQNAIDNEFVCIESIPEGCLLYKILAKPSNLFRGPYNGRLSNNFGLVYLPYTFVSSPFTPQFNWNSVVFVADVMPGEMYKIVGTSNTNILIVTFYANKSDASNGNNAISNLEIYNGIKPFVVPSGATFLVFSLSIWPEHGYQPSINFSNFSLVHIPNYFPQQ